MTIFVEDNEKQDSIEPKTWEGKEVQLQEYVFKNPDSIFSQILDKDNAILPIGKEFLVSSGESDFLFLDKQGRIFITETKLCENADRRRIWSQLIDYAQAIWYEYGKPESVINFWKKCENSIKKIGIAEKGFDDYVKDHFQFDQKTLNEFKETLQEHLSGNSEIYLVVVMDSIEPQIKRTINFLNNTTKFGVFGVELQKYQLKEKSNPGKQIIVPRYFGIENIGLKNTRTSEWYNDHIEGWDLFNSKIKSDNNLDKNIQNAILNFTSELEKLDHSDPWFNTSRGYLSIYFSQANNWNNVVLKIWPDGGIRIFTNAFRAETVGNEFKNLLKSFDDYLKKKIEDGGSEILLPPDIWMPKLKELVEIFKEMSKES